MIRVFGHYISKVFICLFLSEICIFFASMYFGSKVRFFYREPWHTEELIITSSFIFASILSLNLAGVGLYRRNLGWNDNELLSRITIGFSSAVVMLVSFYYFFPDFQISRSVLIFAVFFAFLGLLSVRWIFYKLLWYKRLKHRLLIIGCGKNAGKVIDSNQGYIHRGFEVVGCIPRPGSEIEIDPALVIDNTTIADAIKRYQIDEIVVALDDRRTSMPVDELLDCKISGIPVIDLLSFYEREKAYLDLENLYPSWMVFSNGFAQSGLRTIIKRLFDIVASLSLLLITFPVMIFTALAICLESGFKAPILYRQVRVGENNQNFEILKFRSMQTDAEKHGVVWAKQNDARVTRVGSFIRKSRIDELPQIYNVLKGNMSFVGPRPERPEFVRKFDKSILYYRERHRVKPGITGWAQLCYPYGASENDTKQKLQYDLYYVKNYSLFLDLTVMLHTVEVVLWGKGAR